MEVFLLYFDVNSLILFLSNQQTNDSSYKYCKWNNY